MRYIPKSESFDRRGQGKKLYCIIAGSAVYSGSQLSEVQKAHPQPPPRSSIGGYNVPHLIRKSYINTVQLKKIVDWVKQSATQQRYRNVGFRSSTQPTQFKAFGAN